MTADNRLRYWRTNLVYLVVLLGIWFTVSFLCSIVFAAQLNEIRWPMKGFRLGFWFAQQGSIYIFVVEIFVYAFLMNRLDRKYDVHEGGEAPVGAVAAAPGTPNTRETRVEIDDLPKAED